jgi:hypothetical protein
MLTYLFKLCLYFHRQQHVLKQEMEGSHPLVVACAYKTNKDNMTEI